MIGPVLSIELQQAGRRGQIQKLRYAYSAWLVVQLLVLFTSYSGEIEVRRRMLSAFSQTAALTGQFVNSYLDVFVTQHFVLLLLATPTFVAGAITDEKTRGTLQFLLCADVSSWEIVIGKLLGRLAQVAFVAAAGLPFICFIGGFGSLDGLTLLGLAGATIGPLFGLGAASLLSSVWSRETRDAVLRVYAGLAVGCILVAMLHALAQSAPAAPGGDFWFWWICERLNEVSACLSPIHVLRPSWTDHDHLTMLRRLLTGATAWSAIGGVCATLAAWRLRPAYLRQLGAGKARKKTRAARRHSAIGDDPIAWKEREVEGLALLPALRLVPRWPMAILLAAFFFGAFVWLGRGAIPLAFLVPFVAVSFVGIRASGTVCRERDHQTWDLLLLTPLDTAELLQSKLRGVLQVMRPYLIAYVIAVLLVVVLGQFTQGIAALLYLAIGWGAMHYMAAVGIMWSVRSQSAWKSLLATLANGYISVFALFFGWSVVLMCASSCLFASVGSAFVPMRGSASGGFEGALLVVLALAVTLALYGYGLFFFLRKWSRSCMLRAETWINRNERVWIHQPASSTLRR